MALLNDGRVILQGTIPEIKSKRRGSALTIQLENAKDADRISGFLNNKNISDTHKTAANATLVPEIPGTLILNDDTLLPEVLRFLADNNIPFIRIEKQEATLEDIFIEAIM